MRLVVTSQILPRAAARVWQELRRQLTSPQDPARKTGRISPRELAAELHKHVACG